jgi:hypothetical protein
MTMTPEQAQQLRAPFEPHQIGQKPQPYKKDSPKSNCRECGGYHGMPALHLDYVGHAAATDRLLQVDPAWTWEPFAVDAAGLPAVDREGNLWIRLTIAGVTKPGVGDGVNMKERIGDALRNAAMRFGVALDLWGKEDLRQPPSELAETPGARVQTPTQNAPARRAQAGEDIAGARHRVKTSAEKVSGKQGQDLDAYIVAALTARGFKSDSIDDLNSLASEWEQAA